MNIAIQDAVELARRLTEQYGGQNDGRRLSRYSQARLPRVWRHQEFSSLMLSLFTAGTAGTTGTAAGDGGRESPTGSAAPASTSSSATRGSRAGSPTPTRES